jgi:hypothetical protein
LFGGGWAGKGIIWTFALGRTYGLKSRKKHQAWLKELHDSDRAYYGWLLRGVLWGLVLLGVQLAMEGYIAPRITWPPERQHPYHVLINSARVVMGLAVYAIALNRVMGDWFLRRRFEHQMVRLDRSIARLEGKLAAHQGAAATAQTQVQVDLRPR